MLSFAWKRLCAALIRSRILTDTGTPSESVGWVSASGLEAMGRGCVMAYPGLRGARLASAHRSAQRRLPLKARGCPHPAQGCGRLHFGVNAASDSLSLEAAARTGAADVAWR